MEDIKCDNCLSDKDDIKCDNCDNCNCNKPTPDIKKEVEDLKMMARNWKRGYATSWIQIGEDNEYVYEEFTEDIINNFHPYINRLVECDYLTQAEAGELINYVHRQVEELREETEAVKRPDGKILQFCKSIGRLFTSRTSKRT